MSSTKNIGGSASDKYHRYQMPELQLKVEKPGTNGQRTVVLNIDLVCKSLKVPPEWLSKFWGYELAGQSQFTQTEHGGRTACTIMGNHSRVQVEKVLEKLFNCTFSVQLANFLRPVFPSKVKAQKLNVLLAVMLLL